MTLRMRTILADPMPTIVNVKNVDRMPALNRRHHVDDVADELVRLRLALQLDSIGHAFDHCPSCWPSRDVIAEFRHRVDAVVVRRPFVVRPDAENDEMVPNKLYHCNDKWACLEPYTHINSAANSNKIAQLRTKS